MSEPTAGTQAVPSPAPPTPARGPRPDECRFCGSAPAAGVTFRGHQGYLILARFHGTRGPFCRDCGIATFRQLTASTLTLGWWGAISLVATPITVAINLIRRPRVAALAAPHRDPAVVTPLSAPMRPGRPVLARPWVWVALLILAGLVAVGFVNTTAEQANRSVGGCVRGQQFVPCSERHDYVIVKVTNNTSATPDCPRGTDAILRDPPYLYCLEAR